ncbi:MAG: amylo-alpha-1,6-glucosidase [Planctomycetota bacterium]
MGTMTKADPLVHRRDRAALARAGVRGEWLLTNGLGGFAMGTWAGVPTRRYHGMLIAAERPPVERALLVAGFGEQLVLGDGERIALSVVHFAGGEAWETINDRLELFETGPGYVRWELRGDWNGRAWRVDKRLTLPNGQNAARVSYDVEVSGDGPVGVSLELRPLLGLRDFHGLNNRAAESEREVIGVRALDSGSGSDGVVVASGGHGACLQGEGARFEESTEWWRGIEYLVERERGLDCQEDLFCPGVFISSGREALHASITASMEAEGAIDASAASDAASERSADLGEAALRGVRCDAADERAIRRLASAADAFVVRRSGGSGGSGDGVSVIAGYPWFADWGRDTMICLPGLLLETGRHDEALATLETFAAHRREGVIPNRFDDYGGEPHYNTVDASLWFVHAACAWLEATGDRAAFDAALAPACLDVARSYRRGTMHGIGVDPGDGLVMAGSETTQLTWMDAQRDGVTFTPRHGKAVEINALWIHGLRWLSRLGVEDAEALGAWADEASESFARLFWSEADRCWFDVLAPSGKAWRAVREVRPNQVFAMSLAHGPVHGESGAARETALTRARQALAVVERDLFTPEGLRTLSPRDEQYKGRFWGVLFERDAAYHQGTVWPWLMGSYAEAVLRSEGDRGRARAALDGLLGQLDGWYPGTIAEVFDGDETPGPRGRSRWPAGCIAQAWSIAETLRALRLIQTWRSD